MAKNDRSAHQNRKNIHHQTVAIADRVEYVIRFAVHALMVGDKRLADEIALECAEIEQELTALALRCQSLEGQPEFAASALRLLAALGSARGQADLIATETHRFSVPPPSIARELELLAEQSRLVLRQAILTWSEGDTARARETLAAARAVDVALTAAAQELLEQDVHGARPAPPTCTMAMALFKTLGKVGENARRFCEETINVTARASLHAHPVVPPA